MTSKTLNSKFVALALLALTATAVAAFPLVRDAQAIHATLKPTTTSMPSGIAFWTAAAR